MSFWNENKLDQMCKILEELSKYVPTKEYEASTLLPDSLTLTHKDAVFSKVLIGGDQLTCARIRGAQAIRSNHETAYDRLDGFKAVVEDWHAKMTFLKV